MSPTTATALATPLEGTAEALDAARSHLALAVSAKRAPADPTRTVRMRPSDVDQRARDICDAHFDGGLTSREARVMLSTLAESSGITSLVMLTRYAEPYTRNPQTYDEWIRTRLDSKIMDENFLDLQRLRTSSFAAWVRRLSKDLGRDRVRNVMASGEGRDGLVNENFDWANASTAPWADSEAEILREQKLTVLDDAQESLTDAAGRPRRMTASARIHLLARSLLSMAHLPAVAIPLTFAERDELREILEEDPTLARRSLTEYSADIPIALSAMWDPYGPADREALAEAVTVSSHRDDSPERLEHAHFVALAAVTPYPRPARRRVYASFARKVAAMSDSTAWRKNAKQLAKAFEAVFVDLDSFQSRASEATLASRRAAAEEGRALWDDLMLAPLPPSMRPVASTATDLAGLLVQGWEEAVAEDLEDHARQAALKGAAVDGSSAA